jgi:DNA-binding MarR family transcriptional regulator
MKKSIDILLNNIGHLSVSKSHSKLDQLGLYKGQPPLLEVLWKDDGRTQKEIAETLRVSRATISKMVSRMEQNGFLKTLPDNNDGRITRVYLTKKGLELKEEVRKINTEMSQIILNDFSNEEKELFEKLLLKVKENLK